tara:strand:+ start:58 stop:282 length:225 start_codon:yes stop_codon:yes gene_type:complete
MIIEKIKINRSKEIWVTKNPINGKIVIQIRLCERRNGNLKPTNKCILLNLKSIDKVIKSLEFIKLLESDIYGKS